MPKTKSTASSAAAKSLKSPKKAITKTIRPKKKTKSVLVDVIEDEPINKVSAWSDFKNELPKGKPIKAAKISGREVPEELDQQKRFFSSLASETKERKGRTAKAETAKTVRRSVGLYRRFVVKFIILVAIIAVIVAYFSFSKLTITISPKGEMVSDNLLLKIVKSEMATSSDQTDPREIVSGTIKEVDAKVEKTFPATGEEFIGEEIIGKVRIINNYNKNQALVATTRLLSPDNKLFRIKNAVNVPAGREVTVDIYVEKPAADLAIGPTTFTIPGLWLGLQDKIYAKSDNNFTFQQKVKKYVKPSDLERATKDINELLIKTAKEEAGSPLSKKDDWLYISGGPMTATTNAKAGEQKEEFTAKATGKIIAVSFSKEQAAKLASAKLNLLIPDDKELTEFKQENITYSLENYDAGSGTATVKAFFTGTMVLKSDAEIVDRQQLVNLTAEQIAVYLKSKPEIKDYKLTFSPSFIKKAPSLVDRISVRINN